MKKIIEKIYNPKVIYAYVLLFPLFEAITSVMVRKEIPFTFGMVYKTAFIVYAIIYILFISKSNKKTNYIYMGLLLITILICSYVISGYDIKSIDMKLFKSIIKYINLPVALIFFYTYFKDKKEFNVDIFEYSIAIYCTSIIIAVLTGTTQPTYLLVGETIKLGFKGWFFAGNEIGNLLGIMYPLAIYLASVKKKYASILLCIVTFCTLEVGTKTATLSLVITIISMIAFSVIMSFVRKDESVIRLRRISIILFVILAIYAPFSTSYKILKIRMADAKGVDLQEMVANNNDFEENTSENIGETNIEVLDEVKTTKNDVIEQVIYSGRQDFKEYQRKKYEDSGILNKLFGLKNNEINNIEGVGSFEIVERDFHDVLYNYGIVGTVMFFLPAIYMLGVIAIGVIVNMKRIDVKIVAFGISIALALSVAYIAGHVLLTPAIVMFVSATIAGLTVYSKDMIKLDNE